MSPSVTQGFSEQACTERARCDGAQVTSGQPITALWAGYADPLAWGAILWASLGPGALAAFLQTQARRRSNDLLVHRRSEAEAGHRMRRLGHGLGFRVRVYPNP